MTRSEAIKNKLYDEAALRHKLNVWRFQGRKIVFTNGCFDILHHGHVYLLNKAADCERECVLIVGLNSDASVKRLKGDARPVNTFDDRAYLLASLYVVEAVIGFEADTPIDLIKMINPDYLVKGGDYNEDTIVGADVVKSNGGKIVVVPYLENYSSTGVIERVRSEK